MDSIAELSAALSTAAAKDQQQADFIRMMQNLKLLKRFRLEAVVMEYFTFFRLEGSEVCRNWTCFKDLGPDPLQSPPVIALCRVITVITGTEFMTLPGFSPETSAAVLAGVRQLICESGGSLE